jgi:hypothetical protein
MAAIPPNFGGGHNFINDPNQAGPSGSISDMAALTLQLIHVLGRGNAVDAANQPLVADIADHARQVLAASQASAVRERNTRELRPMTMVPAAPFGVINNLNNIRFNNLPTFSGNNDKDEMNVVSWLSKIMTQGQASQLTFAATINLMLQMAKGSVADYIEQLRDEGYTLLQVVQHLEMRYGDLCPPEEARVKCNGLVRKDNENLPHFIDRLRYLAKMACRAEADNNLRRQAQDLLVESNIRRVLPTSVRNALTERITTRLRSGEAAFTARQIEQECLDLEKQRDERKTTLAEQGRKHHVRQARVESFRPSTPSTISSITSDSSIEEPEEEDPQTFLINEIKYQKKRYADKGKPYDIRKGYKKAVRNYNEKYKPYNRREAPYGNARQAQMAGPGNRFQGPPEKLEQPHNKSIMELLELANVEKGYCIQCSLKGHMMRTDHCPLRGRPLTDRPCVKCGRGLHAADDCVQVYQNKYANQQQAANQIQKDESLNE